MYNDKKSVGSYDTCILIAGDEIDVAKVIAGWIKDEKKVLIGYKPCK